MINKENIVAAEITSELIEGQAVDIKALAQKAKDAADAYLADLKEREAALEKQAIDYRAQIESKKNQRKALAGKINDLSSRGKIDEAAEADMELEALDKSISTLERKLKLVSTAELKGDPKLYKAAQEAHAAMVAGQPAYSQHMRDLRAIVKAERERLEKIEKELGSAADRNHGYYAGVAFEKVERHYRDLDRIEREAKERAAAERAAAEKEKGSSRFIFA